MEWDSVSVLESVSVNVTKPLDWNLLVFGVSGRNLIYRKKVYKIAIMLYLVMYSSISRRNYIA